VADGPYARHGQPAVGAYRRGDDGVHHAHSVQVLTVTTRGIARIVAFQDPDLLATFGLPQTHPSSAVASARRR
jgi:RNA polymerase sigma-70 factor (ECF subfamily)